jgi:two-component system copper resistance phosphate regulon response regulator CusR
MMVHTAAPDVRADENAVRLLLVENSTACVGLLCAALARAARGRFDVDCASCLSTAERSLAHADYDAVVVDLAVPGPDGDGIDTVYEIAHRLPVIALAGTREGPLAAVAEASPVEDEIDLGWDDSLLRIHRANLAATILRAVHRHRRLGVCGNEPTFCRIPAE